MKKYLLVLALGMLMLGCDKNSIASETLPELTTPLETTVLEITSEEPTAPSKMESVNKETTGSSEKGTIDEVTTTVFESEPMSEEMTTSSEPETTTVEPEPIVLPAARVGDTVYFGTYEQDNNSENGQEPICWYVLDEKDGKFFLFSKYILDVSIFDDKSSVWETSLIRKWLNNDFYNTAFTDGDKTDISTTILKNSDSGIYGDEKGADTEDKVFLLSIRDLKNYFGAKIVRWDYIEWHIYKHEWAAVTPYCAAKGMRVNKEGCGTWFIRRLGGEEYSSDWNVVTHYIIDEGLKVGEFNCEYRSYESGIRPAMWVDKDAVCTVVPMTQEEIEPIAVSDDFVIEWKNEVVERETRRITGITDRPLTYGDVKNITKLDFQRLLVDNIDDLVYFTSLEELDLFSHPQGKNMNENTLSDIRALARLKNLTSLKISGNVALDISPLAYVTSLKHLALNCNNLSSIHPLMYLTNLESLVIYDDIVYFEDVNNLESLKSLEISGEGEEFKITENLGGLEELYIGGAEKIIGLENLTNLKSLTCRGANLKSVQGLEMLSGLQRLEISVNDGVEKLDDITGLFNLTNLKELKLSGVNQEIKNIKGIEKLANLESLILWCDIKDLTGIEKLSKLKSLNIWGPNVVNMEDIKEISNLTSLDILGANIEDLSELSNLTNLTNLRISSAEISDISAIGSLTNLVSLDISYNLIDNISVIENLTNLETLKLSGNNIKDVQSLAHLKKLTYLSIRDNPIKDYSPVQFVETLITDFN